MSEEKVAGRRWTTIKIPVELRLILRRLSERFNVPYYKLVWWAIAYFYHQFKRPRAKESLPEIDKISWYITKMAMSAGALRENPTEENLARFEKTVMQIIMRIKVDISYVLRAAQDYVKKPSVENKMELNASIKMAIIDIFYRALGSESEPTSIADLDRMATEILGGGLDI